jgi:hypothetical protein
MVGYSPTGFHFFWREWLLLYASLAIHVGWGLMFFFQMRINRHANNLFTILGEHTGLSERKKK